MAAEAIDAVARARSAASAGWRAALEIELARVGERTDVVHRRHVGPLCIQKPFYPGDGSCHVYVLHPPGGLAGGDELGLRLGVAGGASALVTMPASTKFYRSIGAPSVLTNRLEVQSGGALEWLPTETILFGGSHARLATEVHLDSGAVFVGWEALALGRPLSGDHYAAGDFEQRLEVFVDGRPVLLERLAVNAGDLSLAAPWGLDGRPNSATLLAFPADAPLLEDVRAAIDRCADRRDDGSGQGRDGATIVDGLLVLRLLGDRPASLRQKLETAWRALAPKLLGRAACPPRIWKT